MRATILAASISVTTAVLLFGCSSSLKSSYNESVACVANEMVRHRFIDQEIHEVAMFPKERERFSALRIRAERDAARLNIPRPVLYTAIYRLYRDELDIDHRIEFMRALDLREAESTRCYRRTKSSE